MESISNLFNQISNKKLLVIFPHPDDETVMASVLIQKALLEGFEIKVICVTNGCLGQIHIHGNGKNVVQIRKEELSNAMSILNVTDFAMWRFGDGLLQELNNWKLEVEALIKTFNPGLLLSYGPEGASGHPDHLALGNFIWQYWSQNNNFQLIWPSFSDKTIKFLKEKTKTADRILKPNFFTKPLENEINNKIKAIKAHQSQDLKIPLEWIKWDESEYFAIPEFGKNYNFDYVDFDLGL